MFFLCVVIIVANLNETKGNIFLKKWITTKEKSESSCNIVNSFGSRALGTRRRIVFYPAKFYSDLFVFFFKGIVVSVIRMFSIGRFPVLIRSEISQRFFPNGSILMCEGFKTAV